MILREHHQLRRELSLFDGISIVVGTIIGSAIFLVPCAIANQLTSPLRVFTVWIAGGILSLFGALSIAELGSMYPGAGGLYVYLKEVYGRLPAFLYGWSLFSMIHTGSIAALAVAFGLYTGQLFSLHLATQKCVSITFIALLTLINCFGIRLGKLVQNVLAVIKVTGLGLMILLLLARGHVPHSTKTTPAGDAPLLWLAPLGVALVAVMWSYEGWHVISFAAAEFKDAQRDLPRCLLLGTLIIILIYVCANASYYAVLSPAEIKNSPAVASAAVIKSYGPAAGNFISVLIVVSILGSMNGLVLTGPRVYYAMARDGIFLERFAQTNGRSGVPVFALCAQSVWAIALAWSGTYIQLITNVIFTAWVFYGLTVAGLIVLRYRAPEMPRPFKVPWFPWLSLSFCAAAMGIVVSAIVANPFHALVGTALLLTGLPIYWSVRYRQRCLLRPRAKPERGAQP